MSTVLNAQYRSICKLCGASKIGTHLTYCATCYNAYKRRWYLENRVKEIARCSSWNRNNAYLVARNMRKCRERNPDHYRQYRKDYLKRYPERAKVHDENKRAKRKISIGFRKISEYQWINLIKSFKYKCFYCHKKAPLTMDHVQPLSKGGLHIIENIAPACRSCNSRKHAMDFFDFIWDNGVSYAGK